MAAVDSTGQNRLLAQRPHFLAQRHTYPLLALLLWMLVPTTAAMANPLPQSIAQPILPPWDLPDVLRTVPKPGLQPISQKPNRFPLASMPSFRVAQGTAEDPVAVYLMAGQSNLVGEGLIENLDDPQYGVRFPAANIWGISSLEGDRPRTDFVDLAPGFDGYYDYLGPELSFGRRIVALTHEEVYLIKDGLGATNLENDWAPDGINNSYDRFTQTVDTALAHLTAQGIAYEIKGMVWMQGESDVWNENFAAAYEENLNEFVTDVRSRYGSDLPIAIGLIRGDLPTDNPEPLAQVRAAQRAVETTDTHTYLVDTDSFGDGDAVLKPDAVHYNAVGQVLLGTSFAEALIDRP